MIDIDLAKFLYDWISIHGEGEFQIKNLNNCVEKLREIGIDVDFSQTSTSSLINKCDGSLKWENGKIICDNMFRMSVLPYIFNDDYFKDSKLEKTYYKIIEEC